MAITSINELIDFLKNSKRRSSVHILESLRSQCPFHIKQGHFYKVAVIEELNLVVKFLKTKRERQKYACDNSDSFFKYHKLKTGRQKFPSRDSNIGMDFLYPIWYTKKRDIIVQDLVDTSPDSVDKAMKYFTDNFDLSGSKDIHEGNVGMFGDTPVIFDYWHE